MPITTSRTNNQYRYHKEKPKSVHHSTPSRNSSGEEIIEQGGTESADVEITRGTGGKADANHHEYIRLVT